MQVANHSASLSAQVTLHRQRCARLARSKSHCAVSFWASHAAQVTLRKPLFPSYSEQVALRESLYAKLSMQVTLRLCQSQVTPCKSLCTGHFAQVTPITQVTYCASCSEQVFYCANCHSARVICFAQVALRTALYEVAPRKPLHT